MNIHPDDILTFTKLCDAMKFVARQYGLPLRTITGYPMPKTGMANRMGDCSHSGDIRIVLRCTENGQWCDKPLDPDVIWDVAAHELAHLRHMNHGLEFQDFCEELQVAMNNRKEDHKERIINKILKLKAQREGEAALGNAAAAEAFAAMMNKMLIQNELQPSDLVYAEAKANDPILEIPVKKSIYGIKESKTRSAWQETLAAGVAKAHLCRILVRPGSNDIFFVGTHSHATVAEYVFGCMVPAVEKMSKKAETDYWRATGCGRGANNKALGYRAAWIDAFVRRIWERFEEAKQAVLTEEFSAGCDSSTALVRLNSAAQRVTDYINDKFANRKSGAGALNYRSRNHSDGRAAGRQAADNITLGRRGISTSTTKGQIS
jgi:hypothetical protein